MNSPRHTLGTKRICCFLVVRFHLPAEVSGRTSGVTPGMRFARSRRNRVLRGGTTATTAACCCQSQNLRPCFLGGCAAAQSSVQQVWVVCISQNWRVPGLLKFHFLEDAVQRVVATVFLSISLSSVSFGYPTASSAPLICITMFKVFKVDSPVGTRESPLRPEPWTGSLGAQIISLSDKVWRIERSADL